MNKRRCFYCGISYTLNHQDKCKYGKKIRFSLYSYLIDTCKHFNVPIKLCVFSDVLYNGTFIPFPSKNDTYNNSELLTIIHEIAHWLVASPEERQDKFFGLIGFTAETEFQEQKAFLIQELLAKQCSIEIITRSVAELNED